MTVESEKNRLRQMALATRERLAAGLPDAGARIAAHAGALDLAGGGPVAGYWPMRHEADPRPLMEALAARGVALALPVVVREREPLAFRAYAPGDALESGPFGTRAPAPGMPDVVPAHILVPLLAFDATGARLGYGAGYYDRTLRALRRAGGVFAVGVAFSGQEVAALPCGPHDERLDAVITELGLRRFAR